MAEDDSTENLKALVARARSGDESAFTEMLSLCAASLESYVRRHLPADVSGQIDVQDVLQEVYLEAFLRKDQFVVLDASSLSRWLTTIARHRLIDLVRHHRSQKRGGNGISPVDHSGEGIVSMLQDLAIYERTPSQSAMSHERRLALQVAVEELRPMYRDILRLRYFRGTPVNEIARIIGRGPHAVHMLCNRAIKELRRHLEANGRTLR
jgi:RNA polymerase sigma-70 factor (ECF subfamily)